MREIQVTAVTEAVAKMFAGANMHLPRDVTASLKGALETEASEAGREVLARILENADISAGETVPLCQDTGCGVVFLKLDQDLHLAGGDLSEAATCASPWWRSRIPPESIPGTTPRP